MAAYRFGSHVKLICNLFLIIKAILHDHYNIFFLIRKYTEAKKKNGFSRFHEKVVNIHQDLLLNIAWGLSWWLSG